MLTALLSRKFVSFVANHVDTKLFGGKARSRFRDLVVELEAELEAEQKARRVRKELGGNPFAGHAMAARTEDGRRRSGRNRAAPARYGVESTTTSEESESEDEDEVSSSSSGGEGSGDEAGSQRADADFSVSEGRVTRTGTMKRTRTLAPGATRRRSEGCQVLEFQNNRIFSSAEGGLLQVVPHGHIGLELVVCVH